MIFSRSTRVALLLVKVFYEILVEQSPLGIPFKVAKNCSMGNASMVYVYHGRTIATPHCGMRAVQSGTSLFFLKVKVRLR